MFQDDMSAALGYSSIACWIIVYSPQIYENFKLKSGEGLSLAFVVVWLIGDLCNLVGACLAGLLPTVIILAVYYTFCDLILLFQIFYYRKATENTTSLQVNSDSQRSPQIGEETPLLLDTDRSKGDQESSFRGAVLQYLAASVFVVGTGVVAFATSRSSSKYSDTPPGVPQSPVALGWSIQIIGWTSAVMYLGARIPQIAKNLQTRCEGLSLALFFFSIAGNVTYAASILCKSMDHDYLIRNGAWLAGSGLTVFLDLIVVGQFFHYSSQQAA